MDAYGVEEINSYSEAIEGQKLASHSFILRVMGHLLGKVLTTVEATTADNKQAKAIKDLMRGHFSQEMEFVGDMMFDQNILNELAEESFKHVDDKDIVSVSVDEILGVEEEN